MSSTQDPNPVPVTGADDTGVTPDQPAPAARMAGADEGDEGIIRLEGEGEGAEGREGEGTEGVSIEGDGGTVVQPPSDKITVTGQGAQGTVNNPIIGAGATQVGEGGPFGFTYGPREGYSQVELVRSADGNYRIVGVR